MVPKPKKIRKISGEAINGRVIKMLSYRKKFLDNIENVHVKLQNGNSKTGRNVYTISLIPIADCPTTCKECSKECYDIRNVCFQDRVQVDRAKNSAIHLKDKERFWREVEFGIKYNNVRALRLNIGGDIVFEDLQYINDIAKRNPKCDILFFTKNYDAVNDFLNQNIFEENVHCIFSAWKNTPMYNRYNLPVSHVLYVDGTTTAPVYGAYYCQGNCAACHYESTGCFSLKHGEHVVFPAH